MVSRLNLDVEDLQRPLLDVFRAAHRPLTLSVRGVSMLPLLRTGDAVRIDLGAGASDISVGDIVAYKSTSGIAVHRVLHKTHKQGEVRLYQAGDNLTGGSWLREADIVGKVVTVIRRDREQVSVRGNFTRSLSSCRIRYVRIQTRARLLAFRETACRLLSEVLAIVKRGEE